MSRYDRSDYDGMAYELDEFSENHEISELLRLLTDSIEYIEYTKEKARRESLPGDIMERKE